MSHSGCAQRVSVTMLGRFEVAIDGRVVPADRWHSRRAVELVQLLALSQRHRLHREQVVDVLWPSLEAEAGLANLHKAAHHARRSLRDPGAVRLQAGYVALFPDAEVRTDLEDFERAASLALASAEPRRCAEVAELYGGGLLPDARYEEWVHPHRERLHGRYVDLLRGARDWERVAALDATDEHAHRELMHAQLAAGDRHAALRTYGRLRGALGNELGLGPDAATVALHERCVAEVQQAEAVHLVGREVELVRAAAAAEQARERRVTVLFVRGNSGIGKTTFCQAVGKAAAADGWTGLRVVADRDRASTPYALIGAAVERLGRKRPEGRGALSDQDRTVLARLRGRAPDGADETLPRQRVVAVVRRALAAAAEPGGVLLVLDDAHEADAATLDLVDSLARAEHRQPLLLVLAHQPGVSVPLERLRAALLRCGRTVEVELGPLTAAETKTLASQVAGWSLPAATLSAIGDLAGGTPFIVAELARAVTPEGAVEVPSRLVDALDAGLTGLPAWEVEALEQLAVTSDRFGIDDVLAVTGLTEDAACGLLDRALGADVLRVEDEAYRFRHELVRRHLGRRVPPHRKALAHREAAERLAAEGAAPARVARHWLAAGMHAEAIPSLLAAAEQAASVSAFADALRHGEAVVQLAPRHGDALALRADMLFALGDPGAPTAYAEAVGAAEAGARDEVRVRQAYALVVAGDLPGCRAALVGAQPASDRGRILKGCAEAMLGWATGDLVVAQAAADFAREHALSVGAAAQLTDAVAIQAVMAHSRGRWPAQFRADMRELLRAPDLAARVYEGHLCGAEVWLYGSMPYPEVIDFANEFARTASRIGATRGQAFAATLLGEAELLSGDLAEALPHLVEAAHMHRAVGARSGEALSLQRAAQALVLMGRHAEAAPHLADAFDAAGDSPMAVRHIVSRIYGTLIEAAEAPDAAMSAVEAAEANLRGPTELCVVCPVTYVVPAAVAAARAGDLARARTYAGTAERIVASMWRRGGWVAALEEVRGHVALAEGDVAQARARFADAGAEFDRAGQPLDAARCAAAAIS